MGLDKIVEQMLEAVRQQERAMKPTTLTAFRVVCTAGDLATPCQRLATYHRSREEFYTTELERAEKRLREEGVSFDVYNPSTGMTLPILSGSIGSGSISMGYFTSPHIHQHQFPQYQPRIDERLKAAVDNAKTKMLEHRNKAGWFEKHQHAFSLSPTTKIELTVDEVNMFKLDQSTQVS